MSKAQSQMAVELVTNVSSQLLYCCMCVHVWLFQIIQSVDDLESLVKLAIEVSKGNKPNSSVLLEPERMLLYISHTCCIVY